MKNLKFKEFQFVEFNGIYDETGKAFCYCSKENAVMILKGLRQPNYTDAKDLAETIYNHLDVEVVIINNNVEAIMYGKDEQKRHIIKNGTDILPVLTDFVGEDHFLDVCDILIKLENVGN